MTDSFEDEIRETVPHSSNFTSDLKALLYFLGNTVKVVVTIVSQW